MTIDQLIEDLVLIRRTKGGNLRVEFDTEAREFDCHLVDISSVELVPGHMTDGEDRVVLHYA